jgi:hypothetical protein
MGSNPIDMAHNFTLCEVEKPNGDRYPSQFYGVFQYSDSEGAKPVAVVKLMDGTLGMVRLSAVKMRPATHYYNKAGIRIENR